MKLAKILNSSLLRLSTADRYSGVYLSRKDTVSDHTTCVGLIGILLANDLNVLGVKIDLAQVALKALVHDIDESVTCDVPRNVKYFNDDIKTSLDLISDLSVQHISKIHEFPSLYDLWTNSKDKSYEGFIIKISDMIHVLVKLREELVILNNMHMLKVLLEIGDHLHNISEFVQSDKYPFCDVSKKYFTDILVDSVKMTDDLKLTFKHTLDTLQLTCVTNKA